jgi:hypothetical protein
MNGAVKYDIDSIRDIKDTSLCNDKLLNYLQTKLGFFTSVRMDAYAQRTILKGFPYILKYKGSRKGIIQAVYLFLKSQGIYGEVFVNTKNSEIVTDKITENSKISNTYVVEIASNVRIENIKVLDEILKYIIPAGYLVKYAFYETYNYNDIIENNDNIRIIFANSLVNRQVRLSDEDLLEQEDSELEPYGLTSIGGVSAAQIAPLDLIIKGQNEAREPKAISYQVNEIAKMSEDKLNYKPLNLFEIEYEEEGENNA